jgi:TonB-dependent receptor
MGSHKLEVVYLGYVTAVVEVEVRPGSTTEQEVVMEPEQRFHEAVTVTAEPMLQRQERALNEQKNAINIKNIVSADQIGRFPDPNSAEAAQRISGVTMQRDQGEGRFILVRGTEPRLNSSAINGEQLPAPEAKVRFVALDVIPADLLEAIEVTKAITPDMDGDSIGGAVNLITKQATGGTRGSWTLGLGYNDIVSDSLQNLNGSFAQRSADGKTGVVLSGSYHNTNRGSENFEAEYDDGELDEFQLRHYTVNRKRYGVQGNFDREFGDSSRFFVKGIFNKYDDDEQRRRRVDVIAMGRWNGSSRIASSPRESTPSRREQTMDWRASCDSIGRWPTPTLMRKSRIASTPISFKRGSRSIRTCQQAQSTPTTSRPILRARMSISFYSTS